MQITLSLGNSWVDTAKTFAPIVIAGATFLVGFRQYWTARNALRVNLFTHRIAAIRRLNDLTVPIGHHVETNRLNRPIVKNQPILTARMAFASEFEACVSECTAMFGLEHCSPLFLLKAQTQKWEVFHDLPVSGAEIMTFLIETHNVTMRLYDVTRLDDLNKLGPPYRWLDFKERMKVTSGDVFRSAKRTAIWLRDEYNKNSYPH